ncbi:MAG: glycosyltransferase family 39 protein, partial [Deltaproteobacteria bacterium]
MDETTGRRRVLGFSSLSLKKSVSRLGAAVKTWPYSLQTSLFGLALLVYLSTRLIGLTDFPIYFFSDEAVQTVLAADLLRDGLKNEAGDFLPTYFKNGGQYRLSTSVYIQVLPYLAFGKSIFVNRAISVLVGLVAALAIGLILRDIFMLRYWWVGVLLLSITPAWFLHSRTAFECVVAVAFYALFLYFYLLYRVKDTRYLFAALVAGALAFYSYSSVQIVMLLTGGLLLLSDWRYHWQNLRVGLMGSGLLALLALPYVRFMIAHPGANVSSLKALGSYWVQPLSLAEKLSLYFDRYLHGFSFHYWFVPNNGELVRHVMKGYGNLLLASLPFLFLGLILAFKEFRSAAYRVVLIALLAAPSGAALIGIGITRTLVLVIPAALLTAFGLERTLFWIERRIFPSVALSVGVFAILAIFNFFMLGDSLINGPTWYDDYGMGGMQYGAKQIFKAVQDYISEHPNEQILFSPNWANGTDVVARFMLPNDLPVRIESIDGFLINHLPLDDQMVFVMTPEEYNTIISCGKFTNVRVAKSIPYPNGKTGFYFVRMQYIPNIDEIMAVEKEIRSQLQEDELDLDNQRVKVRYSLLDMGEVGNLFDGDPDTLGRTFEANPFVVELTFPEPRLISGLSMVIGSTQDRVTVKLYTSPEDPPV